MVKIVVVKIVKIYDINPFIICNYKIDTYHEKVNIFIESIFRRLLGFKLSLLSILTEKRLRKDLFVLIFR